MRPAAPGARTRLSPRGALHDEACASPHWAGSAVNASEANPGCAGASAERELRGRQGGPPTLSERTPTASGGPPSTQERRTSPGVGGCRGPSAFHAPTLSARLATLTLRPLRTGALRRDWRRRRGRTRDLAASLRPLRTGAPRRDASRRLLRRRTREVVAASLRPLRTGALRRDASRRLLRRRTREGRGRFRLRKLSQIGRAHV